MQNIGGIMNYCLLVFKSRNETLYFANMLMKNGYRANIINTPKQLGLSCGISVQFAENLLGIAKSFLRTKNFNSFVGFYRVSIANNQMIFAKL